MNRDPQRILLVDDSMDVRKTLSMYLSHNGFVVTAVASASEAREILKSEKFSVMLLDIMMPGEDGLTLCRALSAQRIIPIILLTALNSDANTIRGLNIGADDYISKPFNPKLLLARIEAVIRRAAPMQAETPIVPVHTHVRRRFFDFIHDPQIQIVHREGDGDITLTTGENRVLEAMLEKPGHVFSRDDIAMIIRGPHLSASSRAADNCISRLRKKLGDDARSPKVLVTEWGGGYRIHAEVTEVS